MIYSSPAASRLSLQRLGRQSLGRRSDWSRDSPDQNIIISLTLPKHRVWWHVFLAKDNPNFSGFIDKACGVQRCEWELNSLECSISSCLVTTWVGMSAGVIESPLYIRKQLFFLLQQRFFCCTFHAVDETEVELTSYWVQPRLPPTSSLSDGSDASGVSSR